MISVPHMPRREVRSPQYLTRGLNRSACLHFTHPRSARKRTIPHLPECTRLYGWCIRSGTNVEERLVALHHLDALWKPAEVEQRGGRILRQGNENREVEIYRYVTDAATCGIYRRPSPGSATDCQNSRPANPPRLPMQPSRSSLAPALVTQTCPKCNLMRVG